VSQFETSVSVCDPYLVSERLYFMGEFAAIQGAEKHLVPIDPLVIQGTPLPVTSLSKVEYNAVGV
jgi:hypothetical protein